FICLVALAMGILNSLGHFFMPAFSPAMLNVCWIAAIGFVYFGPQMTPERKVFVLALAILFAGVVQLAMQVPVLRKLGVPIRLDFRFDHPAVRQVARLWAPVVFGMGIVQLNVLMDGLIAIGFSHQPGGPDSFSLFGLTIRYPMQEGANSTLYFAERLYQLPLSVLGTAMATAVLPTFSRHFARGDHEGLAATLSLALRVIFFVGVPASVAIMVLSEPMVDLLFKRGKFTEQSVERTAMVVLFYASGIWAYCGLQVLVRAFHAMQDTKTPVTVGASMVAANVAMNLTFIWFLREAGLALATALSATFQIAILFRLLRRKLGAKLGVRDTLGSLAKTAAASVAMAVACWLTLKFMPAPVGLTVRALRVFAPLAVGGAVFVASAWLLRTAELSLVLKAASKR
ncbi:MAG: murein biosynthesis integral membrane protein MurJ, partial [Planctomycetes bacterium]|nr:murein biosynthesis integral membrane protein MurJ [Planctomycetota bacterium]